MALRSAPAVLEGSTDTVPGSKMPLPLDSIDIEAAESSRVAIVVASDEDRGALTKTLKNLTAEVVVCHNLKTLRRCLLRDKVDLVITDPTLPDGNWADVLRLIVRASLASDLLVNGRTADEGLRSEVMWRGGCGIVEPPYSVESVSGGARNARSWACRSVEKSLADPETRGKEQRHDVTS